MPNATVRANARRMSEATNRRAVLGAILAAGAVASVPAAAAVASPGKDRANELWAARYALRQPYIDAVDEACRAEGLLPAWARPGPARLNPDGTLDGPNVGWPAIQGAMPDPKRVVVVRPNKYDLRAQYRLEAIVEPEAALARYRLSRRALEARLRVEDQERRRLGIPELWKVCARISAKRGRIEERIERLEPSTPNATAAITFLEAIEGAFFDRPALEQFEPHITTTLRFLRPSLTGLIRAHVDELFDRPDDPTGLLQACNCSRSREALLARIAAAAAETKGRAV
jgi:hypothetical protein